MLELKAALTEQLRHQDSPTPELAEMLRQLGAEARENRLRPEELLVGFKQVWNSLPEPVHPQSTDQRERVRQHLVTLCIQAYYAE